MDEALCFITLPSLVSLRFYAKTRCRPPDLTSLQVARQKDDKSVLKQRPVGSVGKQNRPKSVYRSFLMGCMHGVQYRRMSVILALGAGTVGFFQQCRIFQQLVLPFA